MKHIIMFHTLLTCMHICVFLHYFTQIKYNDQMIFGRLWKTVRMYGEKTPVFHNILMTVLIVNPADVSARSGRPGSRLKEPFLRR